MTRCRELIQPLFFSDGAGGPGEHDAFCHGVWAQLPEIGDALGEEHGKLFTVLQERENVFRNNVQEYYAGQMISLAESDRHAKHAYETLHRHTRLIDALHRLALRIAVADLPALIRLHIEDNERDLAFNRKLLPQKESSLARFLDNLPEMDEDSSDVAESRAYHAKIEEALRQDVASCRQTIEILDSQVPLLEGARLDPTELMDHFLLFARGGYGRAELTLESDLDTGYCVDTKGLQPGEEIVFKDMILRLESLLNGAGLKTVHQYFELDEDLSRFALPEALHTIPSIMESRALGGKEQILEALKERFYGIMSFGALVKKKVEEFEALSAPSLTSMDLKEDFGGLRTVQIPLWIFGIIQQSKSFQTADLLIEACEIEALSPGEASRLAMALEVLHDLRNFVGGLQFVQPRRVSETGGPDTSEISPRRYDETIAALYIAHKLRFEDLDDLERHRLQLLTDAQVIAREFLSRMLDRSIHVPVGGLHLSVQLGAKQITAIISADDDKAGGKLADLSGLFGEDRAILEILAYVAESGYELSRPLKDRMGELVASVVPLGKRNDLDRQASLFSRIMADPHAHLAVEALFEISDPVVGGRKTLFGHFIPECDRVYYLIRNFEGSVLPVHSVMVQSLRLGQRLLDWVAAEYQEWFQLLLPDHVVALKWSLFLHPIGRLDPEAGGPVRSAEIAMDILHRIGYRDDRFLERIRLLILNQQALVELTSRSAYSDHAMADYFDLADRDIVNGILLVVMNLATLEARGRVGDSRGDYVRELFEESTHMLAEMSGFPTLEHSLEFINIYLENKKRELENETRFYRLLHMCIARGLNSVVFQPMAEINPQEWRILELKTAELETLQNDIIVDRQSGEGHENLVGRLVQALKNHISGETLRELTKEESTVFEWFFSSFPNRYLFRIPAEQLARQIVKFSGFETERVLVDVVTGNSGIAEGLLIYTRQLPLSHTRVAYALSLKRINIHSGKVNKVALENQQTGFCYYFQVSALDTNEKLHPRDFEALIQGGSPPELKVQPGMLPETRGNTRAEFLGDDGKGYQVSLKDGVYKRSSVPYGRLRVVRRDEPFLFYKLSRVFDRYGVEVQQSLITTTDSHVYDLFYLRQHDFQRLKRTGFLDSLITMMDSPITNGE